MHKNAYPRIEISSRLDEEEEGNSNTSHGALGLFDFDDIQQFLSDAVDRQDREEVSIEFFDGISSTMDDRGNSHNTLGLFDFEYIRQLFSDKAYEGYMNVDRQDKTRKRTPVYQREYHHKMIPRPHILLGVTSLM